MVKLNEGWEERLAEITAANAVKVILEFHDEEGTLITDDETEVLAPLLDMVVQAATKLAYNMVKGVVKYQYPGSGAARPANEWIEHGMDDAADALNYWYLLKRAYEAEHADVKTDA